MGIYRKTYVTNQLQTNLSFYLSSELLDKGFYRNIKRNELDFEGNDLSKFVIDTNDNSLPTGKIWKSPRENWVHEGQVSVPTGISGPIVPSGVYINGTFYPSNHGTNGHVFDYTNGRVIFTSGLTLTGTPNLQVEYSFKEFNVKIPDENDLFNLNNDYFGNDGVQDLEFPFGKLSTPVIYIDTDGHEMSPYALGGGHIANLQVFFHIVFNNQFKREANDMADLITFRTFRGVTLVDIDKMPEMLDFRGVKSSTYVNYKTLVADLSKFWERAYFLQMQKIKMPSKIQNYNRIRLDSTVEIRGISEV